MAMLGTDKVQVLVNEMLPDGEHLHRKRSIGNAVLGLVEGVQLQIHHMGASLARARGLNSKHAVKQVDRLLSNPRFDLSKLFPTWVARQLCGLQEALVALDWTDYDADGHSTISLGLATKGGRAVPLMWKSVEKSGLKGRRNHFEDSLLKEFKKCVPEGVRVTVTADRGFADHKFFNYLKEKLSFDYVIRIKGATHVGNDANKMTTASKMLRPDGRIHCVRDGYVTRSFEPLPVFVSTRQKDMKDAWYLASSRDDWKGAQIVSAYGRRFTIEEMFRDDKDRRFGMGLSHTRIRSMQRRDRLLFLAALAREILTTLGAAGEHLGHDRMLKVNTSKKRTHSLYRQGCHYYAILPKWPPKVVAELLATFHDFLDKGALYKDIVGLVDI